MVLQRFCFIIAYLRANDNPGKKIPDRLSKWRRNEKPPGILFCREVSHIFVGSRPRPERYFGRTSSGQLCMS